MGPALRNTNLLGAVTAMAFYASAILVFVFRMAGRDRAEYWIGV